MADERDKNATGDKQSNFAGTNPDKYGQPADFEQQNEQTQMQDAQNVSPNDERISGEEAEEARRKANVNKE